MKATSLRPIMLVATLVISSVAFAAPDPGVRSTLRIRLLEQVSPQSAQVVAGRFGVAVFDGSSSQSLFHVPGGAAIDIDLRGGHVLVKSDGHSAQAMRIRIEQLGESELTISAGGQRRSYAGHLEVSPDGATIKIINQVPLEEYVASVVSSEYGLDDLEGSKAMAVLARTYGLKVLNRGDGSYDHVDHTASQVYRGTREVTALARQAAEETRGEVLTHNGGLIEAVYFSSSGGHTASNEDVWQSAPHPYLRGKRDPWDGLSPHHEWEFSIRERDLHKEMKDALGLDLKKIEVDQRDQGGRAITIKLVPRNGRARTLPADEFRRIVRRALGERSLRSTNFDMKRKRGTYRFEGGGFGHGVGLSQWGAHGMAIAGKSYRQIIDFYYTDVTLERRASQEPVRGRSLLASDTAPARVTHDALAGRYMPGQKQSTTWVAPPVQDVELAEEAKSAQAPPKQKKRRGRRAGW